MAYNEQIANRVRELIAERITDEVEEKLMFGGVSFMVRDKIAVGVKSDRIMVRIAPEIFDKELLGEGCIPMNHGGRDMKGFLFVTEDVLGTRGKLKRWVDLALDYNERAATEKPKKKAAPAKKKSTPR
jgi:TfoX/Sxy family transcriptional regulator of competence genes